VFDVILLYLFCASTFTISKATLAYAEPIFYVGLRMVLAGIILLLLVRTRIRAPESPVDARVTRSDWWLLAQVAFFAVFCAYAGDLWSLQFLASTESALIFNLSPFMAAFLSFWWFGERMTGRKWLGMVCGVSSIIPLLVSNQDCCTWNAAKLLPIAVLIGSVFSSAYGWIVVRELVKNRHYHPFFVNGVASVLGGILAFSLSWGVECWYPSPVSDWGHFLLLLGLIMIIANGIFSNLYAYLLKKYTATFLSLAGLTCPLWVALLGVIFLREALTWQVLFSLGAVSLGLTLFYVEELRQGYVERQ
jgi:drug/metabolite transporter (DMT)-like permease